MTEDVPIAEIKLKYLSRDVDRHGNARYYVRRSGQPKIRIDEQPATDEFLEAYRVAVSAKAKEPEAASNPDHRPKIDWLKAGRHATFTALRNAYLEEAHEFKSLGSKTRADRRNALDRFCVKNGDRRVSGLTAPKLEQFMDQWSENGPEAANGMLKTLRAALKYAVRRGVVTENVAYKVNKIENKSGGYHTWTQAEIEQFIETHKLGTMAYLTITIALFTGLRRSDIVVLGRQHLRNGRLRIKPIKTERTSGIEIDIPILPELQHAIDRTPDAGDLTLLVSKRAGPYSAKSFGMRFKKWCQDAGLSDDCTLHGLRKAGATIAAENSATEAQLMAIFGWTTSQQAILYTRKARRGVMSDAGMQALKMDQDENKSVPLFHK